MIQEPEEVHVAQKKEATITLSSPLNEKVDATA